MSISRAAFLYAISQEESGGNYNSRNKKTGAIGKYQVLPSNVKQWTMEALGYSMTPEQFAASHSAQDAVANKILGGFYDKYGAEGAASMWFSGQSNPDKIGDDGSTSIRSYVNSVVGIANNYTGSGSTTSTGNSVNETSASVTTPTSPAELAQNYGYVEALFNANPELKEKFAEAVKGQWSTGKFQAELRDTTWWKTHGATERDFLVAQYGDPATAKQKYNQAVTSVFQQMSDIGLQRSDKLNKNVDIAAYNIVAKGWSSSDVKNYLGQYVVFKDHQEPGGSTGQALDQLQQFSYQMGVKNSDAWYQQQARNIARGVGTVEDAQNAIKKQAQTLFPTWSKQIDAGQTVSDLASPYMQSMSTILEVSPGSVNLFDPTIKKALQFKDPKTGANTSQPIWEFENTLRNDPRWKQTKNAQDSIMQTAHQVLSDFGLAF